MSGSHQKKRRRFRMEPAPTNSQDAGPVYPTVSQTESGSRRRSTPPISREKFDSLRRATRSVDHASLQQAMAQQRDSADDSDPITISDKFLQNRYPLSSVLVSIVVHLAIFLTLILFAWGWPKTPPPGISVTATIDTSLNPEKSPDDADTPNLTIDLPDDQQSLVENTFLEDSTSDNVSAAETNDLITDVVIANVTPTTTPPSTVGARLPTLPTGGGLEGRTPASRGKLAASRGGSRGSEIAVEKGLAWIIKHQRPDGSWRLRHDDGHCNGECANPGMMESTTAATGLALMSLLGAGYTHRSGPYQKEVQKGLDYLVEKMRISKHGGSLARGEKGMYSHAIATIALSEAYSMTQDTGLIQAIGHARKYIETAQHRKGGWRYVPGTAGDMTVTGWQLMALKSCELANFPTRVETWQNAEMFVDSLASTSGSFGYQAPEENPTTTAVGVLSKMYLGTSLENDTQEMGTRLIAAQGPSETDVYFNYYATQVLLHRNDAAWPKWNTELRDYLIDTQDQSDSHQAGSWYFPDPHGQMGGRLYTTAMVVMTLEVYYRFMPLYDDNVIN